MDPNEVEVAWAEVRARWADESAHRAFLDGLRDLETLAEAGRRYRLAAEAHADDAVAARWRDEVVKRATVLAIAQLPRTRPPRQLAPVLRRALVAFLAAALLAAVAWALPRGVNAPVSR